MVGDAFRPDADQAATQSGAVNHRAKGRPACGATVLRGAGRHASAARPHRAPAVNPKASHRHEVRPPSFGALTRYSAMWGALARPPCSRLLGFVRERSVRGQNDIVRHVEREDSSIPSLNIRRDTRALDGRICSNKPVSEFGKH